MSLTSNSQKRKKVVVHFWNTYEDDRLLSTHSHLEDMHHLCYLRRHIGLAEHPLFGAVELADVDVWSLQFIFSVFQRRKVIT